MTSSTEQSFVLPTLETGGFSYRQNVVGKPPDPQGMQLGEGWQWAPGAQPEQLLNCLTVKGWAVTPGRWQDGRKSKREGRFIEASYLLLDYDSGMTWAEAKEYPFFQAQALFAYTSPSHQQPGKGDRFRIVFLLDQRVFESEIFDRLIEGTKLQAPGSDRAINSASLLYGSPNAEVHIYDLSNRLNSRDAYFSWAVWDAERKLRFGMNRIHSDANSREWDADGSFKRVQGWLQAIPNSDRSTWVRVAGCLRNIEASGHDWAYDLFTSWSEQGYADYDPEACYRLWESLTAQPGGFIRLKQISLEAQATAGAVQEANAKAAVGGAV